MELIQSILEDYSFAVFIASLSSILFLCIEFLLIIFLIVRIVRGIIGYRD